MPASSHLRAHPQAVSCVAPTGLQTLPVDAPRDSYLYVPPAYTPDRPAPLVLLLHGAGGHAHHGLDLLRHLADEAGTILVAPASPDSTWDVISRRRYGPDVELVDRCLASVFAHYAIDTTHLAIGGFSDGASYALSLGLDKGKLFSQGIAFSPRFMAPQQPRGMPKVFNSHGARDKVLPIDPCSRRLVPRLQAAGYALVYREFDGGHGIPAEIAEEAMGWFLEGKEGAGAG